MGALASQGCEFLRCTYAINPLPVGLGAVQTPAQYGALPEPAPAPALPCQGLQACPGGGCRFAALLKCSGQAASGT